MKSSSTLQAPREYGRKIYLASSWRNERQPELVRTLRQAGHEVYDFRARLTASTGSPGPRSTRVGRAGRRASSSPPSTVPPPSAD